MLNITPHRTLWSFLFSLFFPLKTHFILPQGMAVCRTVCPWGSAAAPQTRGQGREQQGRREERILGPSKREEMSTLSRLVSFICRVQVLHESSGNHPGQEQSLVSPSFFFPLSLLSNIHSQQEPNLKLSSVTVVLHLWMTAETRTWLERH